MSFKSVRDVVALLLEKGFTVVVPNHGSKGTVKGTYHSILRQAGLK